MGRGSLGVSQATRSLTRQILLLLTVLAILALGVGTKLYVGAQGTWVRYYAGGVLYVMFWILMAVGFWPRLSPLRVALGVLVVTCLLETLQLWQSGPLEWVRANTLGRALVGSTFSWWDFPHYAAGAVLGGLLAWGLAPRESTPR